VEVAAQDRLAEWFSLEIGSGEEPQRSCQSMLPDLQLFQPELRNRLQFRRPG
jgi:hypothetical protein